MKQIVKRLGMALLIAGCSDAFAAQAKADSPQPQVKSDALHVCDASDDRTRVPVWEPAVDADGNLSSDPPQQDGQIVYIAIDNAPVDSSCDNAQMFSLARPTDMQDPSQGGLAVNLEGNAQSTDGSCRLRGYYKNQEVAGMHQGWVETYFGAVKDPGKITPDKYCLESPIKDEGQLAGARSPT